MKLLLWSGTPMEKEVPLAHAATYISYHRLVLLLINRGVITSADLPELTNGIIKVEDDAG